MAYSAPLYMEVRWRLHGSDEAWSDPRRVSPVSEVVVEELDRTKQYDFEARNVSACGAKSEWVPSTHTVPDVPAGNLTLSDLMSEVDNAAADALAANAELANIASDNVLSEGEKPLVIRDTNVILTEQAGIDAQATAFGITTEKAAYDSKVATLTSYLATLTSPTAWDDISGNTTIVGTTFRTRFADVYTSRQTLLNAIYASAKSRADTANANTPPVINPQFKNGTTGWTFDNPAGFYQENGGNTPDSACSTYLVRQGQSGGATTVARNLGYVPVQLGQTVTVACCIKSLSANAGAYAACRISWRDANHTELSVTPASITIGPGGSYLQAVSKAIGQAPSGAQFAHFELYYVNHSDGYFTATSCDLSVQPANLAEVPDGGGFGKTIGSRLQNGVPLIPSSGPNLVPNAGFESNLCNATLNTATQVSGVDLCDGWISWLGGAPGATYISSTGYGARAGGSRALLFGPARQYSPLAAHETRYNVGGARLKDPPVFLSGQKIIVKWYRSWNYTSGYPIPSGVTVTATAGVFFYNASGGYLGQITCDLANAQGDNNYSGAPQVKVGTVPDGTASVIIGATIIITNGNAYAVDCSYPDGVLAEIAMDDFYVGLVSDLDSDISDGATYARIKGTDLSSGVHKLGVAGSGYTLGNQLNAPNSLTLAYGAVNSTASISATSAGVVSISAFTVYMGGTSVHYNAVSNAITGLSSGSTYYIYTHDAGGTGGTKTWLATASLNSMMTAGDDIVLAGPVTIPATGATSGGGSTGCPVREAWVIRRTREGGAEHVQAGHVQVGDFIRLVSGRWGRVSHSQPQWEPCVRVEGASGGTLSCSISAPLGRADGQSVLAPESMDQSITTLIDSHLGADVIVHVQPLGERWVQHITVENDFYWTGDAPAHLYSHHNRKLDPGSVP